MIALELRKQIHLSPPKRARDTKSGLLDTTGGWRWAGHRGQPGLSPTDEVQRRPITVGLPGVEWLREGSWSMSLRCQWILKIPREMSHLREDRTPPPCRRSTRLRIRVAPREGVVRVNQRL